MTFTSDMLRVPVGGSLNPGRLSRADELFGCNLKCIFIDLSASQSCYQIQMAPLPCQTIIICMHFKLFYTFFADSVLTISLTKSLTLNVSISEGKKNYMDTFQLLMGSFLAQSTLPLISIVITLFFFFFAQSCLHANSYCREQTFAILILHNTITQSIIKYLLHNPAFCCSGCFHTSNFS